jgi:hypothetical protein
MAADMLDMLEELGNTKSREHKRAEDGLRRGGDVSTNALISLTLAEKERLTKAARGYGLTFSAFLRLAANEYIRNHPQD